MDVTIIVIIIFYGIKGVARGFILTAFNLVGYILAAMIAKLYHPVMAKFITEKTDWFDKINSSISTRISGIVESVYSSESTNFITDYLKLPSVIEQGIMDNFSIQGQMENINHSVNSYVSNTLTEMLINIISIMIVFILSRIALIIIINILNSIAKLPVLRTVNRTSGLILGIVIGVLIVFIAFTILTPIIITSPEGFIAQTTYDSVLGEYFYTNNIIINILKGRGFIKL